MSLPCLIFEMNLIWDRGFGGNEGHDGHILYTLSAVQVNFLKNLILDMT